MSLAVSGLNTGLSTGAITVNIFDGTRKPFSDGQLLITIRDGNQNQVSRKYHDHASVTFGGLSVFQNLGDNYAVIASAEGYKDSGFYPVKISAGENRLVDLMLLPSSNAFNFAKAKWQPLCASRPKLKILFSAGASDDAAAGNRYSDLMDYESGGGACLPAEPGGCDGSIAAASRHGSRLREAGCLGSHGITCNGERQVFCLGRSGAGEAG